MDLSVIELEQEGVGDFTRTPIGIEEALEAHQERVHRVLGIGEQHPQQTDGQQPRRRLRRMRGPQDSPAPTVQDVITIADDSEDEQEDGNGMDAFSEPMDVEFMSDE